MTGFAPRILILINPHSGRAKKDLHLGQLLRAFEKETQPFSLAFSQQPGDLERITRECGKEVDILFVAGGDGSVNEVLNGLMQLPAEQRPTLGILPTGSTCDYARTIGIPKNIQAAVSQLLQGTTLPVDVGQFQNRFFTYVASFGAFSDISYETPARLKHKLGHLAYLLKGLQGLPNLDSHAVTIEMDGQIIEGNFLFGAVTNTRSIGGLIRFQAQDVSLRDGAFELLLLRDPRTPLLRPAALIGMLNPAPDPDRSGPGELLFLRGKQFRFCSPEPLSWTLDGEFGGSLQETSIQNYSQQVSILIPKAMQKRLTAYDPPCTSTYV